MAHAKLSASGSHRWLNCPGSVVLESSVGDSSSVYAEEGTLAHSLGELKLNNWLGRIEGKGINLLHEEIKKNPLYEKSMEDYTDEYVEYVKGIVLGDQIPLTLTEVKVDFSKYVPEGFGTADCLILGDGTLHIIDLKYGKGVQVYAEGNSQLRLYALGAYVMYSPLADIQNIVTHVVQPRLGHYGTEELTVKRLLDWGEEVRPVAVEAYNGSKKLSAGEHCKFCKAKHLCRARAETFFKKLNTLSEMKEYDNPEISSEEVGNILSSAEGIVEWIKDVEDRALQLCLSGKDVPGYKAVEGRSNRKLKDTDVAVSILVDSGVDEALLYERKVISLTNMEKLVGKKEFNSLLKDEIIKPPGKPTLVKSTDKRPAINSAETMFTAQ